MKHVAECTCCGVFGQAYSNKPVSVVACFTHAVTTSFGAICFGSLFTAPVSALRWASCPCLGCCIPDYFNSFAYTQVAIRGVSFCNAARATAHLFQRLVRPKVDDIMANMFTPVVVGNVWGFSGMLATYFAFLHEQELEKAPDYTGEENFKYLWCLRGFGLGIGAVLSFQSANNACVLLEAGIHSLLVCWAEAPMAAFADKYPDIHKNFGEKSYEA